MRVKILCDFDTVKKIDATATDLGVQSVKKISGENVILRVCELVGEMKEDFKFVSERLMDLLIDHYPDYGSDSKVAEVLEVYRKYFSNKPKLDESLIALYNLLEVIEELELLTGGLDREEFFGNKDFVADPIQRKLVEMSDNIKLLLEKFFI